VTQDDPTDTNRERVLVNGFISLDDKTVYTTHGLQSFQFTHYPDLVGPFTSIVEPQF
jgi:hypothetical protein